MKKILFILIISGLNFSVKAQSSIVASSTNTLAAMGDILTMPETDYDFGKIPQGKPVSHVFDVINNGQDSLKIINVQASCGCTTPQWERQKIEAPGQKTAITVGYNAANEGVFTKVITITYNNNKTKQITIKGEVWKTPATSAPENNELGNLKNL
jgi:hypothetical protein